MICDTLPEERYIDVYLKDDKVNSYRIVQINKFYTYT